MLLHAYVDRWSRNFGVYEYLGKHLQAGSNGDESCNQKAENKK